MEIPTLDQATQLRDKGIIDDATFGQIQSHYAAAEQPPPEMVAGPQPPPAVPMMNVAQNDTSRPPVPMPQPSYSDEGKAMAAQQQPYVKTDFRNLDMSKAPQPGANGTFQEGAPPLGIDAKPQTAAPMDMSGLYGTLGGYGMVQGGINMGIKAAEGKAAEQSAFINQLQKDDKQRLDIQQGKQEEQFSFLQQRLNELSRKSEELSSQKLDPDRLWNSKSTGEKLFVSIASILGGAVSGAAGQVNLAGKSIDDAINKDLEQQRFALDQKGKDISTQRGLLSEMMSLTKDKNAAMEGARVAAYNNAMMTTQEIVARYSAPEAKAAGLQLMGKLEIEKQAAMQNYAAAMQKQYLTRMLQQGGEINPALLDEKQQARYVPGLGLAPSPEEGKTMREYETDYMNAVTGVKKLKSIAERPLKSVSRDDIAEADTIAKMVQGALRTQVLGPGTVQENERKMLEAIVQNPTAMFTLDSTNKKRLDTLVNVLQDNRINKAKSLGLATPESRLGFKPLQK